MCIFYLNYLLQFKLSFYQEYMYTHFNFVIKFEAWPVRYEILEYNMHLLATSGFVLVGMMVFIAAIESRYKNDKKEFN